MERRQREELDKWLRHHEHGGSDDELAGSMEQLGELAFDYFISALGGVDVPERNRLNAMRGLFRLVRHRCRDRAGAALAAIDASFHDPSMEVRSRAVSLGIGVLAMIERAPAWSPEPYERDQNASRKKLALRLQQAMAVGLNEVATLHADEFLRGSARDA